MTGKRAVLRLVIGRGFVVSSERCVYCVGGAVLGKRSRFRGDRCCVGYVPSAVLGM